MFQGRALGVHRDQRGVRGLPLAQLVAGGHDLLHQGRDPAAVAQVRVLGDPGAVASEQSGEGADAHEQGEHGAGLRGPPPREPGGEQPDGQGGDHRLAHPQPGVEQRVDVVDHRGQQVAAAGPATRSAPGTRGTSAA